PGRRRCSTFPRVSVGPGQGLAIGCFGRGVRPTCVAWSPQAGNAGVRGGDGGQYSRQGTVAVGQGPAPEGPGFGVWADDGAAVGGGFVLRDAAACSVAGFGHLLRNFYGD